MFLCYVCDRSYATLNRRPTSLRVLGRTLMVAVVNYYGRGVQNSLNWLRTPTMNCSLSMCARST